MNEAQIGTTGDDGAFTPYTLGRGIDVDAVGNIIVNLGFPNATQGKEFVVIASDGSMRHIHCEVPAPGESARADFFACAGIRVQDNAFFHSVEEGVAAALEAKADIVVVCASDDDYAEVAPKVKELLADKAILVVAGAPACTPELEAQGITNFINVKSNVLDTLKFYLKELGI